MLSRLLSTALAAVISVCLAPPSSGAVILITQAKANAGNVTPGDTPGFPVSLSLPGAYRFDTNLTVPAGKAGIEIKNHGVDIDMAGFRLYGFNSADVKVATFGVFGGPFGLGRVRNGAIYGFKFDGIRIGNNQWVVEDMLINTNGGVGINASAGSYARFLNNSIFVNGSTGIRCGQYCHIEGNNVSDNGLDGISIVSGTVLGNTIFSNNGSGIFSAFNNDVGFGNNTVIDNGSPQVDGVTALQPNVCQPVAC